jgi:hypothetical protein
VCGRCAPKHAQPNAVLTQPWGHDAPCVGCPPMCVPGNGGRGGKKHAGGHDVRGMARGRTANANSAIIVCCFFSNFSQFSSEIISIYGRVVVQSNFKASPKSNKDNFVITFSHECYR